MDAEGWQDRGFPAIYRYQASGGSCQLKDQPGEIALGDLVLSGSVDLTEVEVVVQKALLEVRADMLEFNVSARKMVEEV